MSVTSVRIGLGRIERARIKLYLTFGCSTERRPVKARVGNGLSCEGKVRGFAQAIKGNNELPHHGRERYLLGIISGELGGSETH
jgi:hypothetical protein